MSLYLPWDYETEFRSRSCVEDLEENATNDVVAKPIVRWVSEVRKQAFDEAHLKVKTKCLYIALDPATCAFLQATLLTATSEVVGMILLPEMSMEGASIDSMSVEIVAKDKNADNSFSQNSSCNRQNGFYGCEIVSVNGPEDLSKLILLNATHLNEERSMDWTEALFSNISATRVLILSSTLSYSITERLDEEAQVTRLRMLATTAGSNIKELNCAPALKSPKFVGGACAAVISHCQIRNVPAAAYLGVYESVSHVSLLERSLAFVSLLPLCVENQSTQLGANYVMDVCNRMKERVGKFDFAALQMTTELSGQNVNRFISDNLYT